MTTVAPVLPSSEHGGAGTQSQAEATPTPLQPAGSGSPIPNDLKLGTILRAVVTAIRADGQAEIASALGSAVMTPPDGVSLSKGSTIALRVAPPDQPAGTTGQASSAPPPGQTGSQATGSQDAGGRTATTYVVLLSIDGRPYVPAATATPAPSVPTPSAPAPAAPVPLAALLSGPVPSGLLPPSLARGTSILPPASVLAQRPAPFETSSGNSWDGGSSQFGASRNSAPLPILSGATTALANQASPTYATPIPAPPVPTGLPGTLPALSASTYQAATPAGGSPASPQQAAVLPSPALANFAASPLATAGALTAVLLGMQTRAAEIAAGEERRATTAPPAATAPQERANPSPIASAGEKPAANDTRLSAPPPASGQPAGPPQPAASPAPTTPSAASSGRTSPSPPMPVGTPRPLPETEHAAERPVPAVQGSLPAPRQVPASQTPSLVQSLSKAAITVGPAPLLAAPDQAAADAPVLGKPPTVAPETPGRLSIQPDGEPAAPAPQSAPPKPAGVANLSRPAPEAFSAGGGADASPQAPTGTVIPAPSPAGSPSTGPTATMPASASPMPAATPPLTTPPLTTPLPAGRPSLAAAIPPGGLASMLVNLLMTADQSAAPSPTALRGSGGALPMSPFLENMATAEALPYTTLPEAVAGALARTNPDLGAQLRSLLALSAGADFPSRLIAALAALRGRGAASILTDTARLLRDEGHLDLANRLAVETTPLGKPLAPSPDGAWRTLALPWLAGASLQPMQLHLSAPDPDGSNGKRSLETGRFVLELELKQSGPVQFDGRIRPRRLDLHVRTARPFPAPLRDEIETVFHRNLAEAGWTGAIATGRLLRFPLTARRIGTEA